MEYKKTLNLPETAFPMKANLAQRELEILDFWESNGIYESTIKDKSREPFILHDGPPYANGDIHLGHTLNKILKDIVVKYKTMRGRWAPFVPGWDCHGQPIDHQVEKLLKGKDVSVVDFRKRCREYALTYVKRQTDEFRRLGVRGNFKKPYLTLDQEYEATIVKTFAALYKRGLIYQGLKPVYWCHHDQTALAEAEIEYADESSPSIYVKFPVTSGLRQIKGFEGKVSIVIWTTTPWTLPANVAVAVHPNEEYSVIKTGQEALVLASRLVPIVVEELGIKDHEILAKFAGEDLAGIKMKHPILDKESVVVTAGYVTLDQGTGCVHIAPGHGEEDYLVGLEHDLPIVMPVDDQGKFTEEAGIFRGLLIWDANPKIVEHLQKTGVLLKAGEVVHSYPHCWRCKNPVIFRATRQWFVSLDKGHLRKNALEAIRKVDWIPKKGEKRITAMVEERPDWCISRQRLWGVPLPIFYCRNCQESMVNDETLKQVEELFRREGSDAWFAKKSEEILTGDFKCGKCGGSAFTNGTDILDVWFESGTSHAAVLKTRDDQRWPADLYLEGSDQHRGWFQLSLLVSVGLGDGAPFKSVLTHGFLVDGEGRKMSKSLGNVVDPMDVVKKSGADILRWWVASGDYSSPAVAVSEEILDRIAESYRRIRNTVRFLLGNLSEFDPKTHSVPYEKMVEIDRWALLRTHRLLEDVTRDYDRYLFYQVYRRIYNFCVVDLSSFYLDVQKDCLYTALPDSLERRSAQTALFEILLILIRITAPIMSFTAEEVWRFMPEAFKDAVSVETTAWPQVNRKYLDQVLETKWDELLAVREEVLRSLEAARMAKMIGNALEAKVEVYTKGHVFQLLDENRNILPTLFIVSQVDLNRLNEKSPEGAEKSEQITDLYTRVSAATGKKCDRCWNFRPGVGENSEHPTLCSRCANIVAHWPA